MMRSILCYGDSNTWGYNPVTRTRFNREIRWTGILQNLLGGDYLIIEEGLNGRTTVFDDPIEEGRSGKQYLYPCLQTHKPIDLVILMLGTNDLKKRFDITAEDITKGVELLIKKIIYSESGRDEKVPEILLLAPAVIREINHFKVLFAGGREKSKEFSWRYEELASLYDCHFLDVNSMIKVSDADGLHYDPESHKELAEVLALMIKRILPNT